MLERYRNDFDALAALARQYGTRIILMETPVDPASRLLAQQQADRWFQRLGDEVAAEAGKRGMEYHRAPDFGAGDDGSEWPDCCHAPAHYLSAYVRTILGR